MAAVATATRQKRQHRSHVVVVTVAAVVVPTTPVPDPPRPLIVPPPPPPSPPHSLAPTSWTPTITTTATTRPHAAQTLALPLPETPPTSATTTRGSNTVGGGLADAGSYYTGARVGSRATRSIAGPGASQRRATHVVSFSSPFTQQSLTERLLPGWPTAEWAC